MSRLLLDWLKSSDTPPQVVEYIYQGAQHYAKEWKRAVKDKHPVEAITYSFLHLMDEAFEADDDPVKKSITCRKGCSFCCYINVDITEAEAKLIEHHCKEEGKVIDYDMARINLGKEHAPCMFLEGGSCGIYEVRPSACRKYHVASRPELCDSDRYKGGRVVNFVCILMEIIALAIQEKGGKSLPLRDMMLSREKK